jgi:hypothetical protein
MKTGIIFYDDKNHIRTFITDGRLSDAADHIKNGYPEWQTVFESGALRFAEVEISDDCEPQECSYNEGQFTELTAEALAEKEAEENVKEGTRHRMKEIVALIDRETKLHTAERLAADKVISAEELAAIREYIGIGNV